MVIAVDIRKYEQSNSTASAFTASAFMVKDYLNALGIGLTDALLVEGIYTLLGAHGTGYRTSVAWYTDPGTDTMRRRFQELANRWHNETGHLSSPSQIVLHPAYQQIIGMGWAIVPFILEDLQQRGGQWYWALRAITGDSPSMTSVMPTLREIKDAWLHWGRQRHLIRPQLRLAGL